MRSRRSRSSSALYDAEEEVREAHRPRALARGPDAQRGQARRRRRHRALGAHRFRAALLRRGRDERRHAVRQGRRRGGGPRQVRLPRPAHAHDHRPRGASSSIASARQRGEPPLDVDAMPMDDAATYALLQVVRDDGGLPARVARHEGSDPAPAARPLRGHRRRSSRCSARVRCSRAWSTTSSTASTAAATGRSTTCIRDLKPVLEPTYGVILYQEQVMQIAQVLAGYTLGGADLLRRAMGKKKPEEMAKQRSVFVDGAVAARRRPQRRPAHIFDLMEKFAGYGFNKSHSAAYALLVVPDRVAQGALPGGVHGGGAVRRHGPHRQGRHAHRRVQADGPRRSMPPDVNASRYEFAVADARTIRYGLGAIKGVGQGAVEALIAEREAHGPFRSLEDLCRRLDLHEAQPPRARGADPLRQPRCARRQPRDADASPARGDAARRPERARAARPDRSICSASQPRRAARRRAIAAAAPSSRSGARRCVSQASARRWASISPVIRSRASRRTCRASCSRRIADLVSERPVPAAEGARLQRAGRPATRRRADPSRSASAAPRTSLVLDDRTGRIEVTLFDDVLPAVSRADRARMRW